MFLTVEHASLFTWLKVASGPFFSLVFLNFMFFIHEVHQVRTSELWLRSNSRYTGTVDITTNYQATQNNDSVYYVQLTIDSVNDKMSSIIRESSL